MEIDWDTKPTIFRYTLYFIKYDSTHFCQLKVDSTQNGYCEFVDWRWGDQRKKHGAGYRLSDPEDAARYEAYKQVWAWLVEWELVELKPIGPEDKEYFATDELVRIVRQTNEGRE